MSLFKKNDFEDELLLSTDEEKETGAKKAFRRSNLITALMWVVMFAEAIFTQIRYCRWIVHLVQTEGVLWIFAFIALNLFYLGMIVAALFFRNVLGSQMNNNTNAGMLNFSWVTDLLILLIHTWACFVYLPANILPPEYMLF